MAMMLIPVPTLAERAGWVETSGADNEVLEVPRGSSTSYLTHGLFRYPGKLPPPLVAHLLNEYSAAGDIVLDPMSGGGTTAIEAVTSGRPAINFDVNPVSLPVAEALTRPTDLKRLAQFGARVLDESVPREPDVNLAP